MLHKIVAAHDEKKMKKLIYQAVVCYEIGLYFHEGEIRFCQELYFHVAVYILR